MHSIIFGPNNNQNTFTSEMSLQLSPSEVDGGITSLVRSTILHTTYFPMADLATQNSLGRAVIPRLDTEGSTQHTN